MNVVVNLSTIGKSRFTFNRDDELIHREISSQASSDVLFSLEKELVSLGAGLKDLRGIGVVMGAGSFTSTRAAVTIANTLAYALRIPVVALPANWTTPELLTKLKKAKPGQYVSATYSGEANIGK